MEDQIANPFSLSAMDPKARRAFVAFGLWLRLGIIGALGLVGGVLELIDGGVKPLSALTLAIGGGVLVAIGAWRGRAALKHVDEAAVVTSMASWPATAATVVSASSPSPGQSGRRALADVGRRFAGTRTEVSS